jgi:hypothetical protein
MSTEIPVTALTEASLTGTGVFDVLMKAARTHLDEEYSKNRIKGQEYSQVYLGSLTQILQTSASFLLEQRKSGLEAQLLEAQIAETEARVLLVNAQTALAEQQRLNAQDERLLIVEQKAKLVAETALINANVTNAGKQGLILDVQKLQIEGETAFTNQRRLNAVTENEVMQKTICKLQAEFDVLMEQKLKTTQETTLLGQKTATEKAQTVAAGVDPDSVIGKQKLLYQAQTDGFKRDAEQKAAKLMVDSWNVRRTTDEGTVADSVNKLNDATVGRAVDKMLQGVQA